MGMEIYCNKKVKCEKEHLYWLLKLKPLGESREYYHANWIADNVSFELSYTYNAETRELTWGGWSVKCRKGFRGWDGFETTPLNTMRGKSRSLKRLLAVLPLWTSGDDPECQALWQQPWDKTAYWYVA